MRASGKSNVLAVHQVQVLKFCVDVVLLLLHLSDEAPQRQAVVEHLKVVVLGDRVPELLQLLVAQLLGAQNLELEVRPEGNFVGG